MSCKFEDSGLNLSHCGVMGQTLVFLPHPMLQFNARKLIYEFSFFVIRKDKEPHSILLPERQSLSGNLVFDILKDPTAENKN